MSGTALAHDAVPSPPMRRWRPQFIALGLMAILLGAMPQACDPPVADHPKPATTAHAGGSNPFDEGTEISSDGQQTVKVLARPDHPSTRPTATAVAIAKPVLTNELCLERPGCAQTGACTARGDKCVAASIDDCRQASACAEGKCVLEKATCKPVGSCKEGFACANDGRCKDGAEGCVAATSATCRASAGCTNAGACARSKDGRCIAKQATHCRSSTRCKSEGLCSVIGEICGALKDSECKRSAGCKTSQRCLARNKVCLVSCKDSDMCKLRGLCSDGDGASGKICTAAGDADCEQAEVCKLRGNCSRSLSGGCRAGDDVECRRSLMCTEQGRCTFQRGRCVPRSDAECRNATVGCKQEKRCKYSNGSCVRAGG